jgi:hypothetical protein
MANMPDRISFAAASARKAAETYETLGRGMYAMQMYGYCLKNYGLTLSRGDFDAMMKKLEALAEVYKDPLAAAAEKMGRVRKRLADNDSGAETQKKEDQIVALLEDLIKTAEERQAGGAGGKKPAGGQKRQPRRGEAAATAGLPGARRQPSRPAERSAVVPGPVERPTRLTKIHRTSESGDWATLPPRRREMLQQIRDRVMSERHREMISDYRSRLAEEGSR